VLRCAAMGRASPCHAEPDMPSMLCLPCRAMAQVGETPRLTAIAELIEEAVQREGGRGTVLEARKNIFLVDTEVGWSGAGGVGGGVRAQG